MPKKNTRTIKKVTIAGEYDNANNLKAGDVCLVDTSAEVKDYDLVVYSCPRCPKGTYHARWLKYCKSKRYKYNLRGGGGSGRYELFSEAEFERNGCRIVGRVVEVVGKEKKKRGEVGTFEIEIKYKYPLEFGLRVGDIAHVLVNNTAPVGQTIGIRDERGFWFARVCSNDERGIFIARHGDERGMLDEYEYSAFGPVTKIEKRNAEKIAELKKRIERVRRDDNDSICNTTRLYEMERELYDLENPIEEEADFDEWPEAISA